MSSADLVVLEEIERRVLWLAVRIVDAANRERETRDGVKVGGHQASSASLVSVMTALWFAHLDAPDRVAVKPHASPVFHAIRYLLGDLDRSYLTRLRARGGLQSYPSLLGDAELDEGNVWEAVADPATQGLGNVTWVVDFNRQSLDRVVPGVRIAQWSQQFGAAGWHVVEVKYGRRLRAAFDQPGGPALRDWIDAMGNEQYQSLFGLAGDDLRKQFCDGAPDEVQRFVADVPDAVLGPLVTDLGGHDLPSLLDALAACDGVTDRPSVVFAYTVKGWGLPIAGNPRNHSALLSGGQVDELRTSLGLTPATEWDRLDPATPAGQWAAARREHLQREPRAESLAVRVPESTGIRSGAKPVSTQEVFGRVLVDLSRDGDVAPYLVTTAPDVATSTNLAGFINRTGVFAPAERRAWSADPILKWADGPSGQHIELGISEMNLFLLLGQLGLSWDLSGQPLLPVGTVYDPFVLRGLDAFLYGVYSGTRFVVAGTPSGVTLAPEGGAHQSTITPSVGVELPGVTFVEPAYAVALDWLLCDALGRIAAGPPSATRTAAPVDDAGLRRQVLAGAYRLVDAHAAYSELRDGEAPVVHLAASGAVLHEALAAAAELADEGIAAHVVDVTSLDRLYTAWQRTLRQGVRTATAPSVPGALRTAFGDRHPVVTVHDGASHAMAWLGSALGVPAVPIGVDAFGQSRSVPELYELHDLLPGSIVNAALAALSLR